MNKSEYPFVTLRELEKLGYRVQNEMIKKIDISLLGHFGNIVTLEILTSRGFLFSGYNMTLCVGTVLQSLFELLDLSEEDGRRLSEIEDTPCRVVIDAEMHRIGIGHFIEDQFLLECDLKNLTGIKARGEA